MIYTRGHGDLGVRVALRGSRGPIALAGLMLIGALRDFIAARASHCCPSRSVRPRRSVSPGPSTPLGLNLHAGGTIVALTAMLGCYVVVVLASHQLSARAVLGSIAALYAIVLLSPL